MESSGATVGPAPIILFAYKRLRHTRATVESLQNNEFAKESDLHVFCDGPKSEAEEEDVRSVRQYVDSIRGFRTVSVTHRERNRGLAKSVISGVTEIVNVSGRVIVMEDDLVSSPNFLKFMNRALKTYEDRNDVFSVTGYNFLKDVPTRYPEPAFLSLRPSSWGWGTWAERWNQAEWDVPQFPSFSRNPRDQARFNRGGDDLTEMLFRQMDGKLDSWGIRWCFTHFLHDAYCVVPAISKINNIGFDSSGTHCSVSGKYDVPLDDGKDEIDLPHDLLPNRDIEKSVYEFHKHTLFKRMKVALDRWTTK